MLEAPKRAVKLSVFNTHTFVCQNLRIRTHSAANDFWGKTFLDLTGEKKMNQNLSILTGCSAGATVSHPYGATRNNVSYFLFTGKLRCCAVRARENQVSQLISIYWLYSQYTLRLQDKNSTYKGPIDVVKQVVQKNGVLGLYAGMESTFWR